MPEILEVLHLPQQHRVAEVQIGRGRIEPHLDGQRLASPAESFELGLQFGGTDDVHAAFGQVGELFIQSHMHERL